MASPAYLLALSTGIDTILSHDESDDGDSDGETSLDTVSPLSPASSGSSSVGECSPPCLFPQRPPRTALDPSRQRLRGHSADSLLHKKEVCHNAWQQHRDAATRKAPQSAPELREPSRTPPLLARLRKSVRVGRVPKQHRQAARQTGFSKSSARRTLLLSGQLPREKTAILETTPRDPSNGEAAETRQTPPPSTETESRCGDSRAYASQALPQRTRKPQRQRGKQLQVPAVPLPAICDIPLPPGKAAAGTTDLGAALSPVPAPAFRSPAQGEAEETRRAPAASARARPRGQQEVAREDPASQNACLPPLAANSQPDGGPQCTGSSSPTSGAENPSGPNNEEEDDGFTLVRYGRRKRENKAAPSPPPPRTNQQRHSSQQASAAAKNYTLATVLFRPMDHPGQRPPRS